MFDASTYLTMLLFVGAQFPDDPDVAERILAASVVDAGTSHQTRMTRGVCQYVKTANPAALVPRVAAGFAAHPSAEVRAAAWMRPLWSTEQVADMLGRETHSAVKAAGLSHHTLPAAVVAQTLAGLDFDLARAILHKDTAPPAPVLLDAAAWVLSRSDRASGPVLSLVEHRIRDVSLARLVVAAASADLACTSGPVAGPVGVTTPGGSWANASEHVRASMWLLACRCLALPTDVVEAVVARACAADWSAYRQPGADHVSVEKLCVRLAERPDLSQASLQRLLELAERVGTDPAADLTALREAIDRCLLPAEVRGLARLAAVLAPGAFVLPHELWQQLRPEDQSVDVALELLTHKLASTELLDLVADVVDVSDAALFAELEDVLRDMAGRGMPPSLPRWVYARPAVLWALVDDVDVDWVRHQLDWIADPQVVTALVSAWCEMYIADPGRWELKYAHTIITRGEPSDDQLARMPLAMLHELSQGSPHREQVRRVWRDVALSMPTDATTAAALSSVWSDPDASLHGGAAAVRAALEDPAGV